MTQYITQEAAIDLWVTANHAALHCTQKQFIHAFCNAAIQHYRDSLPKSEPYCWLYKGDMGDVQIFFVDPPLYSKPLYTQPALSKEDIGKVLEVVKRYYNELPLGNQPHMISDAAENAITIMQSAIGVMK
jgi:hypothetical protein